MTAFNKKPLAAAQDPGQHVAHSRGLSAPWSLWGHHVAVLLERRRMNPSCSFPEQHPVEMQLTNPSHPLAAWVSLNQRVELFSNFPSGLTSAYSSSIHGFCSLSTKFNLVPLKGSAETVSDIGGWGLYLSSVWFKNRRMQAPIEEKFTTCRKVLINVLLFSKKK